MIALFCPPCACVEDTGMKIRRVALLRWGHNTCLCIWSLSSASATLGWQIFTKFIGDVVILCAGKQLPQSARQLSGWMGSNSAFLITPLMKLGFARISPVRMWEVKVRARAPGPGVKSGNKNRTGLSKRRELKHFLRSNKPSNLARQLDCGGF